MFARIHSLATAVSTQPLLAEAAQQAGINKLDGPSRARALAALAGLIILGFGLVLLTWMGARYTRRYMASGRSGSTGGIRTDEWVRRSNQDTPPRAPRTIPPPD